MNINKITIIRYGGYAQQLKLRATYERSLPAEARPCALVLIILLMFISHGLHRSEVRLRGLHRYAIYAIYQSPKGDFV